MNIKQTKQDKPSGGYSVWDGGNRLGLVRWLDEEPRNGTATDRLGGIAIQELNRVQQWLLTLPRLDNPPDQNANAPECLPLE